MITGIPSGRNLAFCRAFGMYTRLTGSGRQLFRVAMHLAPPVPPRPGRVSATSPSIPAVARPVLRWVDLPHAHQRVRQAAQHQLLQIPDLLEISRLRSLENPLSQARYIILGIPPPEIGAGSRDCPPVRSPLSRRSQPPRPRRLRSWCPTCPSVRLPPTKDRQRLTRSTSAPFRVRATKGPYPASYAGTAAGGADHVGPGFLLPFGCRRWLLGPSCSRTGLGPSLTVGLPAIAGPVRGFRVPHA